MAHRWPIPARVRLGAMLAAMAVYIGVVGPLFQFAHSLGPFGWIAPVSLFVMVPITLGLVLLGRKVYFRSVVRMDLCACLYCKHDLRGIGEQGVCPECGRAFVLDATRREWADLLGAKQ